MVKLTEAYEAYKTASETTSEQIQTILGSTFDELFPIYPKDRFSCLIQSHPVMGVTTLMINLAKSYAANNIPVFYLAIDDGIKKFTERFFSPKEEVSQTVKDNIFLCDDVYSITELTNLIIESQSQVIFIDSIETLAINQPVYATMRRLILLGRKLNISIYIGRSIPRNADVNVFSGYTNTRKIFDSRIIIKRHTEQIDDNPDNDINLYDVSIISTPYFTFGTTSFAPDENHSSALIPLGQISLQ